ncbi:MAG: hypothetical protein ACREMJ_05510 [Gemmatimonadales bacterium]
MLELAVGVLLSAAAVYFVLRPVFRPWSAEGEGAAADEGHDPADDADDVSPRARALRALREIEFDRATGKLSDTDYDALRAQYTAAALDALRRETGLVCPTHGVRPETDAAFCSGCGRRLVAAA